jgi:hypothetical protein
LRIAWAMTGLLVGRPDAIKSRSVVEIFHALDVPFSPWRRSDRRISEAGEPGGSLISALRGIAASFDLVELLRDQDPGRLAKGQATEEPADRVPRHVQRLRCSHLAAKADEATDTLAIF